MTEANLTEARVQKPLWHQTVHSRSAGGRDIGRILDAVLFLAVWLFVFCVPWAEILQEFGGTLLLNWVGFAAFGCVLLRILTTWEIRRPAALHYAMGALAAWSMLSVIWSLDRNSTITRAATYAQLMIAIWLIWESAASEKRVIALLKAYVFGALVVASSVIYNYLTGRTAAQIATSMGKPVWETSRYSVYGMNENDLGLLLATSLPMAIYLGFRGRGMLSSILCWLQLIAGFAAILLTASRGALLATFAGLALFPLLFLRFSRAAQMASLVVCVGMLISGVALLPPASRERLLQFQSEVSAGTMTHRTAIWKAGAEVFREHPFVGVGAGAYGESVVRMVGVPYVAHNTFWSILVELGVIGALILTVLLARVAICLANMAYVERCLWGTVTLAWGIGAAALTWEYRKPTWVILGLLAAHARANRAASWSTGHGI